MSDKDSKLRGLLGVVLCGGGIATVVMDVILAVWSFNHFSAKEIAVSIVLLPLWQLAIPAIAALHGELWALSWYAVVGVMFAVSMSIRAAPSA